MSIEPGQDTRPGPEEPGTPQGPQAPQDIERTGRRALWFGVAALLMMFIPILATFAAGPAGVALYLGIKARRESRRTRRPAPGALAGIILGVAGLVFFVIGIGAQLYLLKELDRYGTCQSSANTLAEEKQCKDRLARDVEKKFGLPEGTINADNLPL